ncbi:hypothetical protein [Candidatus Viadribacter manganicus]|uniref:Uncharacterized protein n=1 Tax=Candidatus Viadribacter manganicus TaxID=1759059 RepID=A0A1B1AF37_9PROT|nr:hypothetical protein [Candidatus Viadribacter manganicus]ANP45183.1 hypothetical protein ATE48_04255 [Candidatus Viadribacter manganicus]
MAIDERIAGYTDKELGTLHDNVRRLAQTGSTAQRAEAERLMPLIDAELAERKARAPVRKPPVRKAAVKKKAAPAKVEAPAEE